PKWVPVRRGLFLLITEGILSFFGAGAPPHLLRWGAIMRGAGGVVLLLGYLVLFSGCCLSVSLLPAALPRSAWCGARAPRPHARGGDAACRRAAAAREHLRAAAPRERIPAPALGRHAPAGHDRDGARVRSARAHRRRADHRARRDDPGADPRSHAGAQGKNG